MYGGVSCLMDEYRTLPCFVRDEGAVEGERTIPSLIISLFMAAVFVPPAAPVSASSAPACSAAVFF